MLNRTRLALLGALPQSIHRPICSYAQSQARCRSKTGQAYLAKSTKITDSPSHRAFDRNRVYTTGRRSG